MVSDESKTSRESSKRKGGGPKRSAARQPRKKRPVDETALRDLALAYVARFSTTAAKLEGYLARKIRERGLAEDSDGRVQDIDIVGMVTRFIELGYIDDDAYARSRSRDLTARGYGGRRVEQALWAAGVEEQVRADNAPSEAASRRAAMLYARKRRFGPYSRDTGETEEDPRVHRKRREKLIAAMLRAGHLYEHVQFILDALDQEVIEVWVIEAEDDESENDVW